MAFIPSASINITVWSVIYIRGDIRPSSCKKKVTCWNYPAMSSSIRYGPMVATLEDWPWSSYPANTGQAHAQHWLDTDWLLSQFGSQRSDAIINYRQFVMAGKGLPSALKNIKHQLVLGDDAFVKKHCQPNQSETLREVSKAHRKSVALTLEEYRILHSDRNLAMAKAYLSGAYTMAEIGKFFAVHYMTVSRAVRKIE